MCVYVCVSVCMCELFTFSIISVRSGKQMPESALSRGGINIFLTMNEMQRTNKNSIFFYFSTLLLILQLQLWETIVSLQLHRLCFKCSVCCCRKFLRPIHVWNAQADRSYKFKLNVFFFLIRSSYFLFFSFSIYILYPAMRGNTAAVWSKNEKKKLYVSGIQTLELTHKNVPII